MTKYERGKYPRPPIEERFRHNYVVAATGCWVWTAATNDGYGVIWYEGRTVRAHRLSYELHIGPIPAGMHACHTCDNPPCVNPAHLFIGDDAANLADMRRKGRGQRGDTSGKAKLSGDDVYEIRRIATTGITHREIAEKFNCSESNIWMIVTRKNWAHIH